jgi:hypothetical protein
LDVGYSEFGIQAVGKTQSLFAELRRSTFDCPLNAPLPPAFPGTARGGPYSRSSEAKVKSTGKGGLLMLDFSGDLGQA